MNKKGFTLVELLVTIAILGIISGLSIPIIRNIQGKNTDRKYMMYGANVLQTAKLYNDSYFIDLFGHDISGCAIVDYETLENKEDLKDIEIPDVSCNSKKTQVKIVKFGDKYAYQWKIGCGKEDDGKAIDTTIVYPKELRDIDFDCTGDSTTSMDIVAEPDKKTGYVIKKLTTKLSIESNTGISDDLKIDYAWSLDENGHSSISSWNQLTFKVPSKEKQRQSILSGDLSSITTKTNIDTVTNADGKYYLLIKVDRLKDILGKNWTKAANSDDKYLSFGPYELDNEKPTLASEEFKITSVDTRFNSNKVKVSIKPKDNHTEQSELKVCVSTTDSCSNYIDYSDYDSNKEIKLADDFNGQTKKLYVFIKDKAGNILKQEKLYTIYKECTNTKDGTNWVDTTGCSKKCGGGTKTQKKGKVDTFTDKSCPGMSTTSRSVSCNTMSCCSKTNTTYGSWSKWSNCSKKCGGGTQTRTRKVTKKSAYDGQVCSTTTEKGSQKCNTMGCCSKTTTSCGSYGSCSKKCGGGTKKRTCTKKSAYDGSKCSSYTDSSSCNTQGCCSRTTTKCGSYGSCSKKCGGGTKKRTCTKYSSYTGSKCSSYTDSAKCNTMGCCSSTSSSCTSKCTKAKTNRKNCYKTYRKTCKYYSRYNGQHCKTTTTTSQKTITGWATCYC